MIRSTLWRTLCALPLLILPATVFGARPNFIVIMADDIGFGDVSAYGSKALRTPNIDRLAAEGVRFTSGYCSASTCTPTRYSFLTGEYAFRRNGTGIAPPNGQLVVPVGVPTIASVLKSSGYRTGVIGKWHLGLGQPPAPDWNGEIKPGPRELGFDYSFLLPTTNDRVPQVFVENGRVAGLDPKDPLWVGDKAPSPDHPTGVSHRHTLKMDWSHGHNQTIHNGISRIGFYTGGQAARFRDEDLADRWVEKTVAWLAAERSVVRLDRAHLVEREEEVGLAAQLLELRVGERGDELEDALVLALEVAFDGERAHAVARGGIGRGADHDKAIGPALFLVMPEKLALARLETHQRLEAALGRRDADRAEQGIGKGIDARRAVALAADHHHRKRAGRAAPQPRGALIDEIVKAKPTGSKGQYIRGASLASTMGPGVRIEVNDLLTLAAKS